MSDAPASQVLQLSGLVSYQEGAVVSRQISKADAGNITLFAFDAGQELSEHTAPYDAFLNVLEGAAEVLISGQKYALQAGDAIIMPAGQPHALVSRIAFSRSLTF